MKIRKTKFTAIRSRDAYAELDFVEHRLRNPQS